MFILFQMSTENNTPVKQKPRIILTLPSSMTPFHRHLPLAESNPNQLISMHIYNINRIRFIRW